MTKILTLPREHLAGRTYKETSATLYYTDDHGQRRGGTKLDEYCDTVVLLETI